LSFASAEPVPDAGVFGGVTRFDFDHAAFLAEFDGMVAQIGSSSDLLLRLFAPDINRDFLRAIGANFDGAEIDIDNQFPPD